MARVVAGQESREALPEYRLAYESPDGPERATGLGSVRIFEYAAPQRP